MKYAILLRDINISGKNKISMCDLKKSLESNGYENVTIYLNSGNIILESKETNKINITKSIIDL